MEGGRRDTLSTYSPNSRSKSMLSNNQSNAYSRNYKPTDIFSLKPEVPTHKRQTIDRNRSTIFDTDPAPARTHSSANRMASDIFFTSKEATPFGAYQPSAPEMRRASTRVPPPISPQAQDSYEQQAHAYLSNQSDHVSPPQDYAKNTEAEERAFYEMQHQQELEMQRQQDFEMQQRAQSASHRERLHQEAEMDLQSQRRDYEQEVEMEHQAQSSSRREPQRQSSQVSFEDEIKSMSADRKRTPISSVFDTESVASVRGARRHYGNRQSSDIFHREAEPAPISRRASSQQLMSEDESQRKWVPSVKLYPGKSNSISQIFGDWPEIDRANARDMRARRGNAPPAVDQLGSVSGVSSQNLHRDHRGKRAVPGNYQNSSQILF